MQAELVHYFYVLPLATRSCYTRKTATNSCKIEGLTMPPIAKTKKKFLTDQAVFKEVRLQGGVYVDKTKHIYDCVSTGKYFFLARPRRFGKSTLCRTMEELFLGNRKLFKGLWIDKSDWEWKKHPVIYLDMTRASGRNSTIEVFRDSMHRIIQNIAHEYGVKIPAPVSVAAHFDSLISALYTKFNEGVVVIIDEYDKPILDLISSSEPYKQMHRELSDLYAVLKPAERYLRLAFLTGVFKFTQTSIFSNLNNLKDLTFDPKAGDLVGYTQEELEGNFSEEIDLLSEQLGESKLKTIARLRQEYNGYRFGISIATGKLSTAVYNPFAINHTFAANDLLQRWFESGSPSLLIQKIKEGKFELIKPGGFRVNFSQIATSCNPDAIIALPLLYYAGYATIVEYFKDDDAVQLDYPNAEVARATADQLVRLFAPIDDSLIAQIASELGKAFRNNNLGQVEELFEMAFAQLTYQIFVSREKYFQSMIMLILIMGRLKVEAEVSMALQRADLIVYTPERIFIIETKFNESASKGLQQIKERRYMIKFKALGLPIEGLGININLKKPQTKRKKLVTVAWETIFKPVRKKSSPRKITTTKKPMKKAVKRAVKRAAPLTRPQRMQR